MLACYSSSTMRAIWNNCFSSLFIINQICFCSITDWKWCIEIAVIRAFMPISIASTYMPFERTIFNFGVCCSNVKVFKYWFPSFFFFKSNFCFDKVPDFEFDDLRAMLTFWNTHLQLQIFRLFYTIIKRIIQCVSNIVDHTNRQIRRILWTELISIYSIVHLKSSHRFYNVIFSALAY